MSLLLVPLCIALAVAVVSYLLFFRAARRDAAPAPPAALVLRGMAYSVAGVLLALAFYPLGPWFRRRCRPRPFAPSPNVYCHGYSSWRTDFGLLVDELDEAVRDLLAAHPGERPLLMGHSLGGLLIRGWLADAANQHLVAGAVTLGTPHQGSSLARLGAGRLARSLAFRGALIRGLEATETTWWCRRKGCT